MTRRGRRLLVALAVALAGSALALALSLATASSAELALVAGSSVVVEPGDTVWSIAREMSGEERDVREVVHAIVELNGLRGAVVVPGQVLGLP